MQAWSMALVAARWPEGPLCLHSVEPAWGTVWVKPCPGRYRAPAGGAGRRCWALWDSLWDGVGTERGSWGWQNLCGIWWGWEEVSRVGSTPSEKPLTVCVLPTVGRGEWVR